MKRVLLTGAGGAASIGVARCLKKAPGYYLFGADCSSFKTYLSEVDDITFLVPRPDDVGYVDAVNRIVKRCEINFIHVQPWEEVRTISANRHLIKAKTFLPSDASVQVCSNKYESYLVWKRGGLKVPETRLIRSRHDVFRGWRDFGDCWLRAVEGAGGRGAVHTDNFNFMIEWLDYHRGWGKYTISEYLSPRSTTWMSLWRNGELIVAQGRERIYWEGAGKFISGVSGTTGACKTISDPQVDEVALRAIKAIDKKPNGIWSVDLCYDKNGVPNPSEINIGKFFTTVEFFARAGLNFPDLYLRLAFGEKVASLGVNPLSKDLVWVRGMDSLPIITTIQNINSDIK